MNERQLFQALLVLWVSLAAISFVVLLRVPAPYGRYARGGWGPAVGKTTGWVLMELPAALLFLLWFLVGERKAPVEWLLLGLWQLHYLHRALVFPLRRRGQGRTMPLSVVGMAVLFNSGNTYLNARWLFTLGPAYPPGWSTDLRFLSGLTLFAAGMALNLWADAGLTRLRQPGEERYRIPRGGAFELVSCPNYLGEIVEWCGWAIATWSAPGAVFALWTAANLVPRALAHHRWYRDRFPDYPKRRRALVPFLL